MCVCACVCLGGEVFNILFLVNGNLNVNVCILLKIIKIFFIKYEIANKYFSTGLYIFCLGVPRYFSIRAPMFTDR